MNFNLLIPLADYQKGNYPTPYFFALRAKDKRIFYFGARHSYDPNHEQYPLLEKFWEDFLKETGKINCIVLVEGGVRPIPKSEIEGIKEGGEASFITFLANRDGIQTYSPEPNQSTERSELFKEFSREQIQYYYFARTVNQWHRRNCEPSFDNYVNNFLKNSGQLSDWKDFDFSLGYMKEVHKKLFDTEFNEKDGSFFSRIVDPTQNFGIINKISAASGLIRDVHILQEIGKLWDEGRNIFVVYGQAHAVMQEPVLRDFVDRR